MLVLASRTPTPVRSGSQLRLWQELVGLTDLGADVHLLAISAPDGFEVTRDQIPATVHLPRDADAERSQGGTDQDRLRWISDGTHPFARVATPRVVGLLEELVRDLDPAVILVSGHEASALLPHLPAHHAAVVLDLHNVFSDLMLDLGGLRAGRAAQLLHRRAAAAAEQVDAGLLAHADLVWVCSELDREGTEAIATRAGVSVPVVAIANTVDVTAYPPPTPVTPPRAVFTAAFSYAPNVHAAARLVRLLDDLPDLHLDLVGAEVSEAVAAMGAHPRVRVTGRVPEVQPYLAAASVAPMPLDGGGGTRLKVAEAASARVPIVATAKAVEGIDLVAGTHYLRIETDDELRDAVRAVLEDRALAERLTTAAHAFAVEHLSWAAAGRAMASSLAVVGFGPA